MQTTIDAVGDVLAVNDDDGDSEESSDGQRLNDSQRATSLASHTAHKAEEMLRRMDIKHKYKSVSVTYILTHTHTRLTALFPGQMPFLLPNQQRQSTEGKLTYIQIYIAPKIVRTNLRRWHRMTRR